MTIDEQDSKLLAALCGKLQKARKMLKDQNLTKSGRNKAVGYSYFELDDFMPAIMDAFCEVGLCGVVSFTPEVATLMLVDTESGAAYAITSPMRDATLRGCHPIQNLGAVETYQRRYLWMCAMEISEKDTLDATHDDKVEVSAPKIVAARPAPARQDGRLVRGVSIESVDEKEGVMKDGRAWHLWTVHFWDGLVAKTFDSKVGNDAKKAGSETVNVMVKPNPKNPDELILMGIQEHKPEIPVREPQNIEQPY
jgi:hypothetical protein